ncbi:alpha/beta fold hydrolase [Robbsia sp. KACC 23696]|uniref:thioesterase II family protein n=1 Tax=Robbsia sp. KACC 23696 TaxID=3149231 RepID=UPI00325A944F
MRPDVRRETVTLLCLPYAGGSASLYREWTARLPDWIKLMPLHMPGRGVRLAMRPMHRWPELIDLLVADALPHVSGPYAIFGHSLGSLVGIELAYALDARHGRPPVWVGASAGKAPSHRPRMLHWLDCPEDEFLDEVRALKGMPEALLQDREFMKLVLPYLRADFHLSGSYLYPDAGRMTPLHCPLLVVNGTEDYEMHADPLTLSEWSRETLGTCDRRVIDAGHFFINTHRDALIDMVVDSLARAVHLSRPYATPLHACTVDSQRPSRRFVS